MADLPLVPRRADPAPSRPRACLRLDRAERARRRHGDGLQRAGGRDGRHHRALHRFRTRPTRKCGAHLHVVRGRRPGRRHAAAHPAHRLRRRRQRRRPEEGPQGARPAQGRHGDPEAARTWVRDRHAAELRHPGRRHRGPAPRPHVVPQEQRARPRRPGLARRPREDGLSDLGAAPQMLFLTGDQIYADDVGAVLLPMLAELGKDTRRHRAAPVAGPTSRRRYERFPALRRQNVVRKLGAVHDHGREQPPAHLRRVRWRCTAPPSARRRGAR